jgi:hypothetical protein
MKRVFFSTIVKSIAGFLGGSIAGLATPASAPVLHEVLMKRNAQAIDAQWILDPKPSKKGRLRFLNSTSSRRKAQEGVSLDLRGASEGLSVKEGVIKMSHQKHKERQAQGLYFWRTPNRLLLCLGPWSQNWDLVRVDHEEREVLEVRVVSVSDSEKKKCEVVTHDRLRARELASLAIAPGALSGISVEVENVQLKRETSQLFHWSSNGEAFYRESSGGGRLPLLLGERAHVEWGPKLRQLRADLEEIEKTERHWKSSDQCSSKSWWAITIQSVEGRMDFEACSSDLQNARGNLSQKKKKILKELEGLLQLATSLKPPGN